jgi:hypothetical protein
MRCSEVLLGELLRDGLRGENEAKLLSIQCMDKRLPEYGGYSCRVAGPCFRSYRESVTTFLSLFPNDSLAIVVGEHEDCGLSKCQTASRDPETIELHTALRTNQDFARLLTLPEVKCACSVGRLALVITRSTFAETDEEGLALVRMQVCAERTNEFLHAAGLPLLSDDFVSDYLDDGILCSCC